MTSLSFISRSCVTGSIQYDLIWNGQETALLQAKAKPGRVHGTDESLREGLSLGSAVSFAEAWMIVFLLYKVSRNGPEPYANGCKFRRLLATVIHITLHF